MMTAEDLDQAFSSAQAAMVFTLQNWAQFEGWLLVRFGRIPVSSETFRIQALVIGELINHDGV